MKEVKTKSKIKEVEVSDEFKLESPEDIKPAKKRKKIAKKSTTFEISSIINKIKFIWVKIKLCMTYIIIAVLAVWMIQQNWQLKSQNTELKQTLLAKINTLQNQTAQEFVNARKIYVCNMEKIYQELKVEERNANFEIELAKLNNDVKAAQKKIDSLKNAKVKADYSDVYLNSLVAKRDKMADDYKNALQQTLTYVNQALSEVATEQGVNTIFRSKATAVNTKYTIDVTPQVLEKIKNFQQ